MEAKLHDMFKADLKSWVNSQKTRELKVDSIDAKLWLNNTINDAEPDIIAQCLLPFVKPITHREHDLKELDESRLLKLYTIWFNCYCDLLSSLQSILVGRDEYMEGRRYLNRQFYYNAFLTEMCNIDSCEVKRQPTFMRTLTNTFGFNKQKH
uniref:Uncharacterized protein n=1 Tax=viral metagenome TaxID=1070528 RepID=A0A6C0CNA4_9ZZZZ